jgi:hypothetical protein
VAGGLLQNKLKDFLFNPFTWGGVGILGGALTSVVPLADFFIVTWLCLAVAVFMTALSGGTRNFRTISAGIFWSTILAAVFWGAYRYAPKPPTLTDTVADILNKVPGLKVALSQLPVQPQPAKTESNFISRFKPPTASEIADEVVKKISASSKNQQPPPPQSAPLVPANPAVPTKTSDNPDIQMLKQQGIQTAKTISDWIESNSKDVPDALKLLETPSPEEEAKVHTFTNRLNSEWRNQFGDKANSLVHDLNVRGLNIACSSQPLPDRFQDNPRNLLDLRKACANAIKEAAEKLN